MVPFKINKWCLCKNDLSGGKKPLGGIFYVCNFDETIVGSWCAFWPPDSPLESKDEEIHLHGA